MAVYIEFDALNVAVTVFALADADAILGAYQTSKSHEAEPKLGSTCAIASL